MIIIMRLTPCQIQAENLLMAVHSTTRLVQALVMSRVDYNNALLYGLPKKSVAPLQRVQNAAARVVSRTRAALFALASYSAA